MVETAFSILEKLRFPIIICHDVIIIPMVAGPGDMEIVDGIDYFLISNLTLLY
jgi:hypothetical protein